MFKKIKKFFKGLFSKKFIHPILDQQIDKAIVDSINKDREKQAKEIEAHQITLNNYLHTYFSRQYANKDEMALAFKTCNKKWVELVRQVNSTSSRVKLNKKAFEIKVKLVLDEISNQKNQKTT